MDFEELERLFMAVVEAASALDAKLTECKKDIDDRFAFAQNHGIVYHDEGYGKEQAAMRKAIAALKEK